MKNVAAVRLEAIERRKGNYVNEYAIESNAACTLAIFLQNKMTIEERKAQFEQNRIIAVAYFAEDAPRLQIQVAQYTPPLLSNELKTIISALWRKQITEAHLQKDTLEFPVETNAYKSYVQRKRD